MEDRRILIVANRTAVGPHLSDAVLNLQKDARCTFVLLVPATPPEEGLTWTEGDAIAHAEERMREGVARLREIGAEIEGKVGDADPMDAIADELHAGGYDAIVLSTFPPGLSRWLKLDLPSRVESHFNLPVHHVIAGAGPAPPGAGPEA